MNRLSTIVLGAVLIVAGAALFAAYIGPLQEAYSLTSANGEGAMAFLKETKPVKGGVEVKYYYIVDETTYDGEDVTVVESYQNLRPGSTIQVVYSLKDPSINRIKGTDNRIFDFVRNVAIGALLIVIGLSIIARRKSAPSSTPSPSESETVSADSSG